MVDETREPGAPESPEQKLARLERLERAADAFTQYFNGTDRDALEAPDLAAAMTFTERLTWRSMALALLRAHADATKQTARVAFLRECIYATQTRILEIRKHAASATRQDLGDALLLLVRQLTTNLISPTPPASPAAQPEVRAGDPIPTPGCPETPGPDVTPPAAEAPAPIILTPDPLAIATEPLLREGLRVAQELRKDRPHGN